MLEPISKHEWTPAEAAHLLNRAGFGGSPADIERLYQTGPDDAVTSLVAFDAVADEIPPPSFAVEGPLPPDPLLRRDSGLSEPERRERRRAIRNTQQARLRALRAWWLQRMLDTPRPLEEKLTLFWHGHFATSFTKVGSAYAMYQQNQTLRRHAAGSFQDLLTAVTRDPAMLHYLDGTRNRRQSPNENYAREVMELFTLGEGHYTEQDVREAARALTGWIWKRHEGVAVFQARFHDAGVKSFLGDEGPFSDTDIVRILVGHPQCARFICGKLWHYFAYPSPEPAIIDGLAQQFRDSGYQLRPVLTQMFRSRAFYSPKSVRTQIKSPVQWLIGSLKVTESPLPDPGLCQFMLSRLGQQLFAPPNVKGWEGGAGWITTASFINRCNYAGVLAGAGNQFQQIGGRGLERRIRRQAAAPRMAGETMHMSEGMSDEPDTAGPDDDLDDRIRRLRRPVVDPKKVLPPDQRTSTAQARASLQWRLFQAELDGDDQRSLDAYSASLPDATAWTDDQIRDAVHVLMSLPHYQLT